VTSDNGDNLTLDHYANDTLSFLVKYLNQPADLLRVASGYFTLQGYHLLQVHLQCKEVRILIGYDQDAPIVLHNELGKPLPESLRFVNNEEHGAPRSPLFASAYVWSRVRGIVSEVELGSIRDV